MHKIDVNKKITLVSPNVGVKFKRRLTLAWPVVSIGSSKVAGLTDGIECTGRSFASGKGDCEHKLESGSSVP